MCACLCQRIVVVNIISTVYLFTVFFIYGASGCLQSNTLIGLLLKDPIISSYPTSREVNEVNDYPYINFVLVWWCSGECAGFRSEAKA